MASDFDDQDRPARVGEVRPTQVMHTFGVGSIVDLPYFSTMVNGLHRWPRPLPEEELSEERLLRLVRSHLGPQVGQLIRPPVQPDGGSRVNPFDPSYTRGIPLSAFPSWMRCPFCELIAPLNSGLFELKREPYRPDRVRYRHLNCPKTHTPPEVIPVRFIRVCSEGGHIDEFPWVEFVHDGRPCSKGKPLLRLREFGASAEAADITVSCDTCNTSKIMVHAFTQQGLDSLGGCTGRHPHIQHHGKCPATSMRAALTGASNLWFALNVSVLSIPKEVGRLSQLMTDLWSHLSPITNDAVLDYALQTNGALQELANFPKEEIWSAIEAKRQGDSEGGTDDAERIGIADLKREEWEVFTNPAKFPRTSDLELVSIGPPKGYEPWIEDVVLAKRLREVSALIGFTRIISPGNFADIDEIGSDQRVVLSRRAVEWVPASEVKGEGIFLKLRDAEINAWLERKDVGEREREFGEAHRMFRSARNIPNPTANFPGLRYVLLHSLSHSLIRQFSIECGYSASSIRERIYASDGQNGGEQMSGILLYTAAPDSEGTLGGLVALGGREILSRHLDQALEDMRLCASDPLCSEHDPTDENLTLHGATCHACLFASETSCERSNKYLDRSVLVDTIAGSRIGFFKDAP